MIKLFSAAGNGSPGCPKLLYTHYKMVAGIREKGQDVCVWLRTQLSFGPRTFPSLIQNKQENVKI